MQVLVHSPYDFPEVGGRGFTISGGKVAYIGVDARHTSRYFFLQKRITFYSFVYIQHRHRQEHGHQAAQLHQARRGPLQHGRGRRHHGGL